jgi:dipeptidyl-peptidase-4
VIAEMRIVPVVLIAAGIVAGTASATAQTASATTSTTLTVERVAQLPSIIGTAPASPTWSPDSRWIAFRWNESGWPFRDVYVVRADGTGLKRLTDMQLTDPAPAPRPRPSPRKPQPARAAG